MKTEKMSRIFNRIMLGIFLFIMLFSVGFKILDLGHKSYMLAFLAAAAVFAAGFFLLRKIGNPLGIFEKLGSFKTGLILTAACFFLNLIWILVFRLEPDGDYLSFWNAASELSRGESLSGARYMAMFPHIMGYAAFLSLFLRIFGESVMTAAVLNLVLTTISGLIIYKLCLRWADIKTAALAFILWIFCPSKLLYNSMVLSEPYYTCMLLLFLLILSYLEEKNEKSSIWLYALWAVPAGLVLGLMNTARPIAAVPVIAFFIWLLLLRGRKLNDKLLWKRWLSFALVFVAVYVSFGSCWKVFLEKKLGEEPSGTPGYSVCVGFNPDSMGSYSQEDMDRLVHYTYDVYGNSSDAQKQMMTEALERIKEGEVPVLKLFAVKLRTLLGNDEGGVFYSRKALSPGAYSLLAVISNVFYYLLIMLMTVGAVKLWKEPGSSALLICPLYVIGLSLAHMLVEVAGRYHYSIIPMLIIVASCSCRNMSAQKEKRDAA